MSLRKYIRRIIEESVLNEFITKDEVYLRDYFSMPENARKEYLPHEYYYFFEDFLAETDIDFVRPKEAAQSNYADEDTEEVDMFDNDAELMTWLEKTIGKYMMPLPIICTIK